MENWSNSFHGFSYLPASPLNFQNDLQFNVTRSLYIHIKHGIYFSRCFEKWLVSTVVLCKVAFYRTKTNMIKVTSTGTLLSFDTASYLALLFSAWLPTLSIFLPLAVFLWQSILRLFPLLEKCLRWLFAQLFAPDTHLWHKSCI